MLQSEGSPFIIINQYELMLYVASLAMNSSQVSTTLANNCEVGAINLSFNVCTLHKLWWVNVCTSYGGSMCAHCTSYMVGHLGHVISSSVTYCNESHVIEKTLLQAQVQKEALHSRIQEVAGSVGKTHHQEGHCKVHSILFKY